MAVKDALIQAISDVKLLDHPFYVAWSEGKLSQDDLRFYAGQYYKVVEQFPDLLAATLPKLRDPAHRRTIVENLADEEGVNGPRHPDLWVQFGTGVGAAADDVRGAESLPETTEALENLARLMDGEAGECLAALWAVEAQAPDVSASKIRGLKEHYGIVDEKALEYFRLHGELDVEHSNEEAIILEDVVLGDQDLEAARSAAREAAKALRRVLDGVVRHRGIAC